MRAVVQDSIQVQAEAPPQRSQRRTGAPVFITLVALLALAVLLKERLPVGEYYYALSLPFIRYADTIGAAAEAARWPVLGALLFGLLGALAPCQLASNLAAVGYAARNVGHPDRVAGSVAAYVLGKVTVYGLIGAAVALLGTQIQESPALAPAISGVRKAMGPALLLVGLAMFDALPVRVHLGGGLANWFEARRPQGHILGPYGMGVAFAFAFCPTLFWLFFGLTLPLAVGTGSGIAVPIAFALGTAVPVLGLGLLVTVGGVKAGPAIARTRRLDRGLSAATGAVFLALGFNEFVLYWLA